MPPRARKGLELRAKRAARKRATAWGEAETGGMGQEGTRMPATPPLSTPDLGQAVQSVLGRKPIDEAMAVKKIFDVASVHGWLSVRRIKVNFPILHKSQLRPIVRFTKSFDHGLERRLINIKKVIVVNHRPCGVAKIAYGEAKVANAAAGTETHKEALLEFRLQLKEKVVRTGRSIGPDSAGWNMGNFSLIHAFLAPKAIAMELVYLYRERNE